MWTNKSIELPNGAVPVAERNCNIYNVCAPREFYSAILFLISWFSVFLLLLLLPFARIFLVVVVVCLFLIYASIAHTVWFVFAGSLIEKLTARTNISILNERSWALCGGFRIKCLYSWRNSETFITHTHTRQIGINVFRFLNNFLDSKSCKQAFDL